MTTNRVRFAGLSALCIAVTAPGAAAQDTTNWKGANNSWFIADQWDNGVPTGTVHAVVDSGEFCNISKKGAACLSLVVGKTKGPKPTVTINAARRQPDPGTLETVSIDVAKEKDSVGTVWQYERTSVKTNFLNVGQDGTGIYRMFGGTLTGKTGPTTVVSVGAGSDGTAELDVRDGTVLVKSIEIGGGFPAMSRATMKQAKGKVVVEENLTIGDARLLGLGAGGDYTKTGGDLEVKGQFILGSGGSFDSALNGSVKADLVDVKSRGDRPAALVGHFDLEKLTAEKVVITGDTLSFLPSRSFLNRKLGTIGVKGNVDVRRVNIEIELAGPLENDRVNISGKLKTVNGTKVSVRLLGDYAPKQGDFFFVLDASEGFEGGVDVGTLPKLADGLKWKVEVRETDVKLSVIKK